MGDTGDPQTHDQTGPSLGFRRVGVAKSDILTGVIRQYDIRMRDAAITTADVPNIRLSQTGFLQHELARFSYDMTTQLLTKKFGAANSAAVDNVALRED